VTGNNETAPEPLDVAKSLSQYPSKVYCDDGELYVSSDEVRIRDRSWKLEDIEYVNLECFEGWVWRVVIAVIQSALAYVIYLSIDSYNNLFFMVSLLGISVLVLNCLSRYLWDDLTGFYSFRVFLKDSSNSTARFGARNTFQLGLKAKCPKRYITFSNAVNKALNGFHKENTDDNVKQDNVGELASEVRTRDFSVSKNAAKLYGMTWLLNDISKIVYSERSQYKYSEYIVPFIICSIYIPIVANPDFFLKADNAVKIHFWWFAIIMVTTAFLYHPVRFVLKLRFADGTRKTITKWHDDPAKDALNEFADAVRIQMKLNRKTKRNEQYG
jgi:hypothetical protein